MLRIFAGMYQSVVGKAAEVLKSGGLILYPTDTVWGLGCDPNNEDAVRRIIQLKKKNEPNGLIVIVPSWPLLQRYVKDVPEVCHDLVDFATKPLTIVYPKGQFVSPPVLAKDGSIAVRLTTHKFCVDLMTKARMGIISTSANFTGESPPVYLSDVHPELQEAVDYVVDLPQEQHGVRPSQIVKVGSKNEIIILRK